LIHQGAKRPGAGAEAQRTAAAAGRDDSRRPRWGRAGKGRGSIAPALINPVSHLCPPVANTTDRRSSRRMTIPVPIPVSNGKTHDFLRRGRLEWRIASIVAVTNGSREACLQASACWRCAAGVRDRRGEPSRKSRILIAVKKSLRSAALKEPRFAGSGNAVSRYSSIPLRPESQRCSGPRMVFGLRRWASPQARPVTTVRSRMSGDPSDARVIAVTESSVAGRSQLPAWRRPHRRRFPVEVTDFQGRARDVRQRSGCQPAAQDAANSAASLKSRRRLRLFGSGSTAVQCFQLIKH